MLPDAEARDKRKTFQVSLRISADRLNKQKNIGLEEANMDYVKFGKTGLGVSRLCLGCMTYGIPDRGPHPWTLDEEKSRPLIRQAVELGIFFFDTANVYSDGTSEEIIGRALKEFTRREDIVIATKLNGRMRPGPNGAGLSRKAIFGELDNSLRRLGTDFVDLYQIHRWDPTVPIEETMEALHDVVKCGKVRYVGASNTSAWQLSKALYTSRLHGWTEFVSMQDHINLLYREEEREMLPLCIDQGIAVMPWSPMARGRLTRPWDETSSRQETDEYGKKLLYPVSRLRPPDHRSGQRGRGCQGRAARAGSAGLGSAKERRDLADRRGVEAGPFEGCGGSPCAET
jgi:aryl-alcohol dehydrogenase-like predicted oxidoreductase